MDETNSRIYAAAALSPLSIMVALPVVSAIISSLRGEPLEIYSAFEGSQFLLWFAYPALLFIGIAAYLILRRFKLATVWAAMAVGYLSAACVPIVLDWDGVMPPFYSYWLNPFFFFGPLVGVVFWWIAKPRAERRAEPN